VETAASRREKKRRGERSTGGKGVPPSEGSTLIFLGLAGERGRGTRKLRKREKGGPM